ncbi:hypothetical protein RF55_10190 [Lasius niger]|uniref:Uncharacterized protein n=1 Tax=Lasius niger TaxID=67767 RepID=A0A0J7KIM0_LASNI|nr:hypothetical protein RF55_10190 [Lasius niger]
MYIRDFFSALILSAAEREAYLNRILGNDDDESDRASDSEDDDWLPDEVLPERVASDSDEPADDLGNQEVPAAQKNDEPTEEDDEEDEDAEE